VRGLDRRGLVACTVTATNLEVAVGDLRAVQHVHALHHLVEELAGLGLGHVLGGGRGRERERGRGRG
jgi:hypothetical protein